MRSPVAIADAMDRALENCIHPGEVRRSILDRDDVRKLLLQQMRVVESVLRK